MQSEAGLFFQGDILKYFFRTLSLFRLYLGGISQGETGVSPLKVGWKGREGDVFVFTDKKMGRRGDGF